MAIGLGTALVLMQCRSSLHGTVKLIFQPAEEGVRGAKSIVDGGHLAGVDYVLGGHLSDSQDISSPYVGVGDGLTLATTKMDITFTGAATHAGVSPQLGRYAMLAAATAILNLHAIPRHGDTPTRVNVGKITGGTARNIVCDQVTLEAEVRAYSSAANDYMFAYAERIVKQAAAMHDCTCEIKLMGSAKCGINSPELSQRVMSLCQRELHLPVQPLEHSAAISEDYSYMSDYVMNHQGQSCYFHHLTPCAGSFHNRSFDFDERALVNGVKAFSGVTASLLH